MYWGKEEMINKVSVQDCTLCGACVTACPVNAVSFDETYLDFCYPKINLDRCIHCKQCEKACPILNLNRNIKHENELPIAFAAKCKNDSVRLISTSGGAFYALAKQMLQEGGYICGAVFDDDFHVKHIVSNKDGDLLRMLGSKYAQSNSDYCYREIKQKLNAGYKVLFSGCPCQVAALSVYLGKDYPDLLLVELICHGIPSDRMLQTYIGMKERQYGAKLKKLEFRNKTTGWHRSAVRMEFANHRIYSNQITADAYMNGFLRNVTLKPSCYHCHFRGFTTGSDIVLGDFWGAETELPAFDDNKGISAVLANTAKGYSFLRRCSLNLVESDAETVIRYNKNLLQSAKPSPLRTEYYNCVRDYGLDVAIRRHLSERCTKKLARKSRFFVRCLLYRLQGKGKPLY